MRQILRFISHLIGRTGLYLAMLLVVVMTLHITAETLSRLAFGKPLVGTVEIVSYYYMIAIAFLPLGFVQETHEHIEAEIFSGLVPKVARGFAFLCGFILSIGITFMLLRASLTIALRQTGFGEAIVTTGGALPVWPGRWMVVIGFTGLLAVMLFQLFTNTFRATPKLADGLEDAR